MAANLALRDRILSFFGPKNAASLVEYAKFVSDLKTDYIICMARKSVRLLDLLALAGCPTPKRPIVYSHVLEQGLSRFKNKTVTLIDDTLILGTTLGRAERLLLSAGARSVDTVVFSIDSEYWDRRLINPTKHFQKFEHNEMLSFCSNEVQAFNALSIPYLTDFPIVNDLRLTQERFTRLQGLPYWDTHPLTSGFQRNDNAACFSVLPVESRIQGIDEILGNPLSHALEIAKIRVYSRRDQRGAYWIKVVPVCTLHPLDEANVERAFCCVIENIQSRTSESTAALTENLSSPISKLRFSQYIISGIVGAVYLEDLIAATGIEREPTFSSIEASRLFGHWHRPELDVCHLAFSEIVSKGLRLSGHAVNLKSTRLPVSVLKVTNPECEEFLTNGVDRDAQTLESKLGKVFLKLHEKHELPARNEAREQGDDIFSAKPEDVPHRDRLSYGFSWGTIAENLIKLEGFKASPRRVALLSLLLDRAIDTGVAVPIICERDGVFFRAYRHGEDVPFENQEKALAYDAASGYLEGAKRTNIPRIEMEKLLVSLIQVGTQKQFLVCSYGLHGLGSSSVRIGYHLHGAIANFPSGDSPLADNQTSWLSRHLVDEGVLKRDAAGLYILGARPEAATITPTANTEAKQLGFIIGLLCNEKGEDGQRVLSTRDLISITTCARPRDTALALVAELKIILDRLQGGLGKKLAEGSGDSVTQLDAFLGDTAYEALQSARFKMAAWRSKRAGETILRCARHLESIPNGSFFQSYWLSLWPTIVHETDDDQRRRFEPWIQKLYGEIERIALGFAIIEIALVSAVAVSGTIAQNARFLRAREKAQEMLGTMEAHAASSKLIARIREIVEGGSPISKYREALQYGIDYATSRQAITDAMVKQVISAAHDFGRMDSKRNFQYAVWYDLIDSTGQKSGLKGDALRAYRDRIRMFKTRISQRIFELQRDAARRSIVIHAWSNSLVAKDDEKNIFVYGPMCISMISELIEIILNEAQASSVRLRMAAMNTDFAGDPAFKYTTDPEVEGDAFWEHSSRVKGQLKEKENPRDSDCSVVWLLDNLSRRPTDVFSNGEWSSSSEQGIITTRIENFSLRTKFFGGRIKTIIR